MCSVVDFILSYSQTLKRPCHSSEWTGGLVALSVDGGTAESYDLSSPQHSTLWQRT